ncbi:hypothetical protein EAH_00068320, partial [Eimeria acervulina]
MGEIGSPEQHGGSATVDICGTGVNNSGMIGRSEELFLVACACGVGVSVVCRMRPVNGVEVDTSAGLSFRFS